MAGEAKTAEQLQQELNEAVSKNEQLTGQVRGLAAERDSYRAAANAGADNGGGASNHVLAKATGMEGDYGPVDAYYVTQARHTQELQQAVNSAYALARGDMMVLREIDRSVSTHKDLGDFASPLSKKTLDILQKEGYGNLRRDPTTGAVLLAQGWEDLVYSDPRGLPRAARMAQAELILAEQAAAVQAGANASAQGAAGMASGGAPVVQGSATIQEDAWMKAAESGDTSAMREMLKQHATAVTGAPA